MAWHTADRLLLTGMALVLVRWHRLEQERWGQSLEPDYPRWAAMSSLVSSMTGATSLRSISSRRLRAAEELGPMPARAGSELRRLVTLRASLCHARVTGKPEAFCGMSRCPVVLSLSLCDAVGDGVGHLRTLHCSRSRDVHSQPTAVEQSNTPRPPARRVGASSLPKFFGGSAHQTACDCCYQRRDGQRQPAR